MPTPRLSPVAGWGRGRRRRLPMDETSSCLDRGAESELSTRNCGWNLRAPRHLFIDSEALSRKGTRITKNVLMLAAAALLFPNGIRVAWDGRTAAPGVSVTWSSRLGAARLSNQIGYRLGVLGAEGGDGRTCMQ
jgi:hypothetical protein